MAADKGIVGAMISLVIGIFVMYTMIPVAIEQIQTVNTTTWNFTGHVGAALMFTFSGFVLALIPLIYIVRIALGKSGGGI